MLGSPRTRLRFWIHEHVFAEPAWVASEGPIYSFSFDDVPRSAFLHGAPLVEEAGVRATFYVAGQLSERGGFITLADAAALHARGHHIACHSYSHDHGSQTPARLLRLDAARNRALLAHAIDAPVEDFAWPYGEVSLWAKRGLRHAYRTLRGTRPGINVGRVDLACLRALSIYGPTFTREKALAWIQRCAEAKGWLIFYTHGVEHQPGAGLGTSPEDLQWLLHQCAGHGQVLSVREARQHLFPRQEFSAS